MHHFDRFLFINNFRPEQSIEEIDFEMSFLNYLQRQDLSDFDKRFIIDSLFSRARSLLFFKIEDLNLDRSFENVNVFDFWESIFSWYSISYRLKEDTFFVKELYEKPMHPLHLLERAVRLNIKELPIDYFRYKLPGHNSEVKKALFNESIHSFMLELFTKKNMEYKIRSEFVELVLNYNNSPKQK